MSAPEPLLSDLTGSLFPPVNKIVTTVEGLVQGL